MTDNNNYIGRYTFSVEPFQEDFTGHLSWNLLGMRLLQCASQHASAHGFGNLEAAHESCVWVLSRLTIEIQHRPSSGESYTIETWVDNVYRRFTDRHYRIIGSDGSLLGAATSVWALIGRETRKPVMLEGLSADSLPLTAVMVKREVSTPVPARIKSRPTTPERLLTAYYSDLDINGHVNSIRYIDHVLDLFPCSQLACQEVKRIDMSYGNEAYHGDRLALCHDDQGGGVHVVDICKEPAGSPVAKARIVFAEPSSH